MQHILVIEDDKYRRTITLEEATYSIGRHQSNKIVLSAKKASRKHATLIRKQDIKTNRYSYWILDGDLEGNKSVNGIFVNGEKCLVKELKNGDLINFGCEVSAVYHALNGSSSDTFIRLASDLAERKEEKVFASATRTAPSQKTTFILSEPNLGEIDYQQTIHGPIFRDSLSGLPNATLFNEYLSIALSNARRSNTSMAVLVLNIDGFQKISDSLSTVVGDRLLQDFASRLNGCFRSGDIVSRLQGDEFGVLLPRITSLEDLTRIAERIVSTIVQPFEVSGDRLHLSTRLGMAVYPRDAQDAAILLKQAKINLQSNKEQKTIYTPRTPAKVDAQTAQLVKVKNLLHHALQGEQFDLHYQPQVNVNTGEIDGMEALLRWQHPQFGQVSPSKFIPLAEQTDLIVPIGRWVLKTACLQNQTWQKAGFPPLPISVNLSPQQLKHPHLLKMVSQVLEETGLDPHLLELEITEKALLQDMELACNVIQQLQTIGVRISMDDFGTGYSALGYLDKFTLHTLKIAQAYVRDLTKNPHNTALIAAAVAVGRNLNLRVVAEGVETQQQLDLLRSLQCEEMQGYRFSQPLKAEDATKFLSLYRTLAI